MVPLILLGVITRDRFQVSAGTTGEAIFDRPTMKTLQLLRDAHHHDCVVCGTSTTRGLGLCCQVSDEMEVTASFDCSEVFQGYPNVMHGGVISSLLDGVMTNCLFAHGRVAVTTELRVRFRHPVATGCRATVRAWIGSSYHRLYILKAELVQNDQVKATAEGKFWALVNQGDSTEIAKK